MQTRWWVQGLLRVVCEQKTIYNIRISFIRWPESLTSSNKSFNFEITKKKEFVVGLENIKWDWTDSAACKAVPLWQCHRPWPRPLGGLQAGWLCGICCLALGPLWCSDLKGALEIRCHRRSLLSPVKQGRNHQVRNMQQTAFRIFVTFKKTLTWIACTSLLLSSKAAEAVEVPKDAAPLWSPRIMRPSFLYCSMGSQNRSRTPWTEKKKKKKHIKAAKTWE